MDTRGFLAFAHALPQKERTLRIRTNGANERISENFRARDWGTGFPCADAPAGGSGS